MSQWLNHSFWPLKKIAHFIYCIAKINEIGQNKSKVSLSQDSFNLQFDFLKLLLTLTYRTILNWFLASFSTKSIISLVILNSKAWMDPKEKVQRTGSIAELFQNTVKSHQQVSSKASQHVTVMLSQFYNIAGVCNDKRFKKKKWVTCFQHTCIEGLKFKE